MAFTDEQRQNAAVIIRVGQAVGASARDILIALMTAMQESGLRNLDYGDRDSVGLFQQRPSMAWGTVDQIRNPEYAARAFFLGAGTNKGLLDYSDRGSLSLTEAAQTVQRSAFPDAYAKHETAARNLLDNLGDGKAIEGTLGAVPGYEVDQPTIGEALADTLGDHPATQSVPEVNALGEYVNNALDEAGNPALGERTNVGLASRSSIPGTESVPGLTDPLMLPSMKELGFDFDESKAANGWRGEVIDLARQVLGVPYVWGGSTPAGFDCSGLLAYIYKKVGIDLPRISADQANAGQRVSLDELKPGDLVAWDNSVRNNGADHIAIYIGNGQIIHAPRPGASVEISPIFDRGNAWGVALRG